jgi:hypothetical protein
LKSKWNNEYKVRYDTAVAAGETDKVKQIKTEFIQLNKFDPDELDKQMMGVKTQFRAYRSIIKKRSSEALLIMYYNK